VTNPFLQRGQRQAKQPKSYWRSKKQEKELSKRLQARQISGSGSGFKKGDAYISGIVRIEAKTTLKQSFSITREMVRKVNDAAVNNDEVPVIVVEFLSERGVPECEVAVVPVKMLEILIHGAQNSST